MAKAKLIIIIIVVSLVAIVCAVLISQIPRNIAINLEEQVMSAKSDIQVQEKRRSDLIPNLVDCVKQYDKHEYETLQSVIKERGLSGDDVSGEIQLVIKAVAEQYPELKSNQNYVRLMTELSLTENLISEHRSNYNYQVKRYKRYVKSFPERILLDMMGYDVISFDYLDYAESQNSPSNIFE